MFRQSPIEIFNSNIFFYLFLTVWLRYTFIINEIVAYKCYIHYCEIIKTGLSMNRVIFVQPFSERKQSGDHIVFFRRKTAFGLSGSRSHVNSGSCV